jgi:GT2 family glycosyltransferase
MNKAGVSVIIINYNTYSLTCKCIESVIKKTSGVLYEIIVVDNASTECNPDKFKENFPTIRLIKSNVNLGFSKGNNLGIEHASYDYLLLLNSDTELINNAILLAYQRILKDPAIGALSSKLLYPDGRVQPTASVFPSLKRELRELFRINKSISKDKRADYYLGDQFDHLKEKEAEWIWGAFFLTRKRIVDEFPGKKLHDSFFMYWEDVQWCYFLKKKGYKVLYYPEAEVLHHLSGSSSESEVELKKYNSKILPNLFQWMLDEKGNVYTYAYFFTKIVHALSQGTKNGLEYSRFHFKFLMNYKKAD